jgi:hypothetical protein
MGSYLKASDLISLVTDVIVGSYKIRVGSCLVVAVGVGSYLGVVGLD